MHAGPMPLLNSKGQSCSWKMMVKPDGGEPGTCSGWRQRGVPCVCLCFQSSVLQLVSKNNGMEGSVWLCSISAPLPNRCVMCLN